MESNAKVKSVALLWQDYLFLTREMFKLLTNEPDMELFMDLISQRGRLQTMIEQHPDDGYSVTPAGKSILMQISQEDQAVRLRLQFLMNRMQNREKINQAYDAFGASSAGSRMDYRK